MGRPKKVYTEEELAARAERRREYQRAASKKFYEANREKVIARTNAYAAARNQKVKEILANGVVA